MKQYILILYLICVGAILPAQDSPRVSDQTGIDRNVRLLPTPPVAANISTPEFEALVMKGRQLLAQAQCDLDSIKAEVLTSNNITFIRCEPDWGGAAIFYFQLTESSKEFEIATRRASLSVGIKYCSEQIPQGGELEAKLILLIKKARTTMVVADDHAEDLSTLATLLADRALLRERVNWEFRSMKIPK